MHNDSSTLSAGVVEQVMGDGHYRVRLEDGVRICYMGSILRRVGVEIGEGDRVMVRTEADGVFRGEITQVRPPLEALPRAPRAASAGLVTRTASPLRPVDQKVDRTARPGWATAAEHQPAAGDVVYCTAGEGTVLRVLGRTGNGSRLLEIRIAGQPRTSFFAAASNVLIEPTEASPAAPPSAP